MKSNGETKTEYQSTLDAGPPRFLAYVIEHGLSIGRRTPGDFVRHFPPARIMAGLERRPTLRADIIEPTTGIRRAIALRKTAESSGEDLQIAMDEGEATAAQVVELFGPDERVKYLDNEALWDYVIEGEFWQVEPSDAESFARAQKHIAFIIDRALTDGLLTHGDILEGITVETLAESLPRSTLAAIINASLRLGRDKKGFTDVDLLDTATATVLVGDVNLAHIWNTVIRPRVAQKHGLARADAKEAGKTSAEAKPATASKPTAEKAAPKSGKMLKASARPKAKVSEKVTAKVSEKGTGKAAAKGTDKATDTAARLPAKHAAKATSRPQPDTWSPEQKSTEAAIEELGSFDEIDLEVEELEIDFDEPQKTVTGASPS